MRPIVEKFLLRLEARLGELEDALAAEDAGRIGEVAAWLRGAGATVGLAQFTAPAAALLAAATGGETARCRSLAAEIASLFRRIERFPAAPPGLTETGKEPATGADSLG
ncbi:MAG: Hpt domain-containing protein [Gammaproteobacteria bacterium]